MRQMTTSKDTWYKTELIPPEEREFYVPIPGTLGKIRNDLMGYMWSRQKTDEELQQDTLERIKNYQAPTIQESLDNWIHGISEEEI